MRATLQIVPADRPRREAGAWFVPAGDPQTLLAELARSTVALDRFVIRPIPRSFADRAVLGFLVSVDPGERPAGGVSFEGLAVPYGRLAGRLFLPVDADIWPEISESELAAMLPPDGADLVWHPSVGLVRCDLHDRRSAEDLVAPPRTVPSCWDRAVAGIRLPSRLLSIDVARPSAEEILAAAGGEIGSQSGLIEELPPAPGEGLGGQIYQWTRPLRQAWRSLRNSVQQSIDARLSRRAPGDGPGRSASTGKGGWPGWLGAAMAPFAAAGAVLGKLIPQSLVDQAQRLREIDRLMHLLNTDPDAGLKFAIPLGGDAGRGLAAPTNQLVPRDISFGLGKLLGGHAVDPWLIPPSQQVQLLQKYRELAAREIRMGRHRRAAYIYAELLADLQSAAGALESGRHFREASVLYRDRLKRPHDAARCLERGGLLDEAAELYLELGMIEAAADLYFRLERPDEAHRLLWNLAAQLACQGHYVRASEILDQKLHAVDEALDVLDQGWKQSNADPEACWKQIFKLLGQHSRHAAARQRVDGFRQTASICDAAAARVLAGVATSYVDQSVRTAAADATRIVVARQLPGATPTQAGSLLVSLQALAPQDKLLRRDCDRFVRRAESAVRNRTHSPRRGAGIFPVRTIELTGAGIQWSAATSNGRALYAAGFDRGGLLLRRLAWTDRRAGQQDAFWANVSSDCRVVLDASRCPPDQIWIHAVGAAPLAVRGLLGGGELAGSPPWASSSTVDFATSDGGSFAWRVRSERGRLTLTMFGPDSNDLTNADLQVITDQQIPADVPVRICASARPVRISVGRMVCRTFSSSSRPFSGKPIELGGDIESLHNYCDTGLHCMVALFNAGGVMLMEPIHLGRPVPFAGSVESPSGTFLHDGTFIIAGEGECQAYRFDNHTVRQVGQISLDAPAVAVTRTSSVGQFAVLDRAGRVEIFALRL